MEQNKMMGSVISPSERMTLDQYQRLAMRTAKDFGDLRQNLIHAGLGVTSDAGEVADVIKSHAVYGKELDVKHLIEELGDTLWYIALAASTVGYSLAEVAQQNIEKLRLRYPDKYSDELAIKRLDKEGGDRNGQGKEEGQG